MNKTNQELKIQELQLFKINEVPDLYTVLRLKDAFPASCMPATAPFPRKDEEIAAIDPHSP